MDYLAQVDPGKGKFRSFLLAAINHFRANEWDRANAVKRGGRVTFLALDHDSAEQRLAEISQERSPEQIFERCWALAFLQEVLAQLRDEVDQAGRSVRTSSQVPAQAGRGRGGRHGHVGALGALDAGAPAGWREQDRA